MAENIYTFRALLISPKDVQVERTAVSETAIRWNAHMGDALKAHVDIIRWETHSSPDLSGPAQEVLDRQIVDSCDFGIAIFWSRLGTPTENHPSGSVEEIERLRGQGKRVMLYFCDRNFPADIDPEELRRLRDVRARYESLGLIHRYVEPHELNLAVLAHLSSAVKSLLPSRLISSNATSLARALSADESAGVSGSWAVDSLPLRTRSEMYSEIVRQISQFEGSLHVRATSILPDRERNYDLPSGEYLQALASACRHAADTGYASSYTIVMAFQEQEDGSPPPDRQEAIRTRQSFFEAAGASSSITIFQTRHSWLLDLLTINDECAVIGFPAQASDPHLSYAIRLTGRQLVSQITQWFDTCVLPSARLVDPATLKVREPRSADLTGS